MVILGISLRWWKWCGRIVEFVNEIFVVGLVFVYVKNLCNVKDFFFVE